MNPLLNTEEYPCHLRVEGASIHNRNCSYLLNLCGEKDPGKTVGVSLVGRIARGTLGFTFMLFLFFFLNGALILLSLSVFKLAPVRKGAKGGLMVCCHELQIRHSRALDPSPSCVYMAVIC